MGNSIAYNGFVIEPTTRRKGTADAWTLEVRITPVGRQTGVRRCRAPNTFPTEDLAVARCLEFGRRIVDGKLQPKRDRAK